MVYISDSGFDTILSVEYLEQLAVVGTSTGYLKLVGTLVSRSTCQRVRINYLHLRRIVWFVFFFFFCLHYIQFLQKGQELVSLTKLFTW